MLRALAGVYVNFMDHALSKLLFVDERVQTDDGKEFGRIFIWCLFNTGIRHPYFRSATPL